MTPDFTLIWPLSCLKDGVHLSVSRMRWTPYYAAGAYWAAPDLSQAGRLMRHVFEHREEARERGRLARTRVEREFNRCVVGRLMVERLREIDDRISAQA